MDVLRISIRRVEREREGGGELRMVVFGVFTILRRLLFSFYRGIESRESSLKTFRVEQTGGGIFFLIRRMDLIDSVDEGEGIVNYYDRLISHEIAHPRLELLLRACCYSWYIILC